MKTLEDIKLIDTMPDSISKDEKVKAAAEALDPKLQLIAKQADIVSIYLNLNNLSNEVLNHLAVQFDLSVWRDSWPLSLKRSVIKTAITDKRKKGTLSAVKKALESLGSACSIVEWWQQTPEGTPGTFKIYATQSEYEGVISDQLQEDIIAMVDDVKPASRHYDLVLTQSLKGNIGIYGHLRTLTVCRLS